LILGEEADAFKRKTGQENRRVGHPEELSTTHCWGEGGSPVKSDYPQKLKTGARGTEVALSGGAGGKKKWEEGWNP